MPWCATILLLALMFVTGCGSSSPASPTNIASGAADFSTAVETVLPAVVVIEVDLGGGKGAAGTGWVVDSSGHIATNNHVIDGAVNILVTLNDGRQFTTTTAKGDASQDLAVIKIGASNLSVATAGDSSSLKVGQPVAAIGNSLDMGLRATGGIVSRLDVTVTYSGNNLTLHHLIETDAVLNPGNSGGVLIDESGKVVGITNASLEGPTTDVDGFDYAIPISQAMPVINTLASQLK